MFFARIFSLIGGKLSRWLKARKARDPEAVYEAAISERLRRYNQLKTAAAGVIYMRNKLARELKQKAAEMAEVAEQSVQAADMNEDECAMILIRRKHELEQDCTRLKDELSELTSEADEAKKNLIAFKGEIEKLRSRKSGCSRGSRTRRRGSGFSTRSRKSRTRKISARSKRCANRSSARSRRPA